jgi:alkylation response protein AidB-like acyl-CoA dehydrogenase
MDLFHDSPLFQGVRQMMGAFAKQSIRPIAIKHDAEESMPWELMKQAQAFGMTQTTLLDGRKKLTGEDDSPDPKKPKSQARMSVVASEELAYGCAGIALALGGSGLACAPVARMGTEDQKAEFRRLMKGPDDKGHVKVAAMALSEPATGSDISGLKTTARPDGDFWIIRGSKQWITNGQSAAVYVVWAQTDERAGRAGVRGFIVARDTPGLVPGKKETKLGIRASETAQVHFEDVRVHKDMMLGVASADAAQSAGGLADTKKMLDSTRPVVGSQAVGIARAAYEYLLERVKGGTVQGTPMASHQHIMFELAEMQMARRSSSRERRRSIDGEGARRAHGAVGDDARDGAARRGSSRAGASRREVVPRREDLRHLRGHRSDPAPHHREAPDRPEPDVAPLALCGAQRAMSAFATNTAA